MSWQGRSLVSKVLEIVSRPLLAGRDIAVLVDVDVALRFQNPTLMMNIYFYILIFLKKKITIFEKI